MKLAANKVKGRLGMNYVERVALAAGCKPIAISEDLDTGIDGFIEFAQDGHSTKLIAFQVKRGDSFFDNAGPKHQTDPRHLRYWIGYAIPVLLIIVRDDESAAFWMDVRAHLAATPMIVDHGPYVLRPPSDQRFCASTLEGAIRQSAQSYDFGDAITALTDPDPDARMSALSLLYRFKFERRAIFCLAAALRLESDPTITAALCDFYSRYLPHPEAGFGTGGDLRAYAARLVAELPRTQVLNLLRSFDYDETFGDWSGATEIFRIPDELIWHRYDTIERGTAQQGIAEVMRIAATPETLLSVLADESIDIEQRKAAAGLFGYLDYTCATDQLDAISGGSCDEPLRALIKWLRHWIVVEGALSEGAGDSAS